MGSTDAIAQAFATRDAEDEKRFGAPAWVPTGPGDILVGVVACRNVATIVDPKAPGGVRDCMVVTVEPDNALGTYVALWGSSVLAREFEALGPALCPMARIAVRYDGLSEKVKKGWSAAKLYKVVLL